VEMISSLFRINSYQPIKRQAETLSLNDTMTEYENKLKQLKFSYVVSESRVSQLLSCVELLSFVSTCLGSSTFSSDELKNIHRLINDTYSSVRGYFFLGSDLKSFNRLNDKFLEIVERHHLDEEFGSIEDVYRSDVLDTYESRRNKTVVGSLLLSSFMIPWLGIQKQDSCFIASEADDLCPSLNDLDVVKDYGIQFDLNSSDIRFKSPFYEMGFGLDCVMEKTIVDKLWLTNEECLATSPFPEYETNGLHVLGLCPWADKALANFVGSYPQVSAIMKNKKAKLFKFGNLDTSAEVYLKTIKALYAASNGQTHDKLDASVSTRWMRFVNGPLEVNGDTITFPFFSFVSENGVTGSPRNLLVFDNQNVESPSVFRTWDTTSPYYRVQEGLTVPGTWRLTDSIMTEPNTMIPCNETEFSFYDPVLREYVDVEDIPTSLNSTFVMKSEICYTTNDKFPSFKSFVWSGFDINNIGGKEKKMPETLGALREKNIKRVREIDFLRTNFVNTPYQVAMPETIQFFDKSSLT